MGTPPRRELDEMTGSALLRLFRDPVGRSDADGLRGKLPVFTSPRPAIRFKFKLTHCGAYVSAYECQRCGAW